jgi:hypothetical protein
MSEEELERLRQEFADEVARVMDEGERRLRRFRRGKSKHMTITREKLVELGAVGCAKWAIMSPETTSGHTWALIFPETSSLFAEMYLLYPECRTGLLLTFEWLVSQEKYAPLFADDPLVIEMARKRLRPSGVLEDPPGPPLTDAILRAIDRAVSLVDRALSSRKHAAGHGEE